MLYDHCTICIWYTGEQVSDGSICLFVDFLLRLRDGFDFIGVITTWLRNYDGFSNNVTGFVDDNLTEMVTCSMYVFGYFRLLLLLGLIYNLVMMADNQGAIYRNDEYHCIFLSRKLLTCVGQYRVTDGYKHKAWRWVRVICDLRWKVSCDR
jgi:hypothetical protein